MLDASARHPGRSGLETLRLAALQLGVPRSRVEEMVDLVGLTGQEAGRRVRTYSLGMRQRLGLAAAFMGDPQVLILDEPVNGLDPQGIHWMRGLLRDFADRGGMVLLSSHLLHEIEAVADELVVIGGGRIVAQGSLDELLTSATTGVRSLDDAGLSEPRVEGCRHLGAAVWKEGKDLPLRTDRAAPRDQWDKFTSRRIHHSCLERGWSPGKQRHVWAVGCLSPFTWCVNLST